MTILRKKEIRTMDENSRKKKIHDLKLELMKLKSQLISGGVSENPGKIRALKRTLARIETIRRESKKR